MNDEMVKAAAEKFGPAFEAFMAARGWDPRSDDKVEPAPAIDWEARFQQAISDGIRGRVAIKTKLAATQLELDQANRRIAAQSLQITKLDPEKIKAARHADHNAMDSMARRIDALSITVASLRTQLKAGELGAMERAIKTMQEYAATLPTGVPEP